MFWEKRTPTRYDNKNNKNKLMQTDGYFDVCLYVCFFFKSYLDNVLDALVGILALAAL